MGTSSGEEDSSPTHAVRFANDGTKDNKGAGLRKYAAPPLDLGQLGRRSHYRTKTKNKKKRLDTERRRKGKKSLPVKKLKRRVTIGNPSFA